MREPSSPPVAKREILGWAMFDFANSSYTTVIVTVGYAVYFTTLVAPEARADWLWGTAVLASNLLVLVLSPIVGAIADGGGRKKAFLSATWLACVAATGALWLVTPGMVALGMALFVVSNLAYALGESLCGAFLPEISTPETAGRVSGIGWGLGYFGGLACLLLVRPLIAGGFVPENLGPVRLAWVVTAAFFFLAAIPTFAFLRERAPRRRLGSPARAIAEGFARIAATARTLGSFHDLALFLVVFFIYSCGLMTVITFAGIYASRTIGFTPNELVVLFIVLQLASAAGALGGGPVQDRLGSRTTLKAVLVLWILVCVGAWAAASKAHFWGVALGAGLGIGSLQASSRGLVGLFSPRDKAGEFFGFWGLAMRAAYALGPFIFGTISSATGSQRWAVLATSGFFVLGFLGLSRVDERRGRQAARVWRPEPQSSSSASRR